MKYILNILIVFNFVFCHELYKQIKIHNPTISTLHELNTLGAAIDHADYKPGEYIEFAASMSLINRLDDANIDFEVIHEDLQDFYASRLYNIESRDFDYGSMGGYYTHQEIIDHLEELSNEYPSLVSSLQVIGQSLEGRDIYAVKLSDNPNIDENEPEVLYTGLHHAREPMSYMNLFYYMYWLVENYNTDQLASGILNNRELWFIPCLNPDGLIYNQEYAPNGGGMQRKNHRETCSNNNNSNNWDGIDLNRNYSYMWGYDDQGSSPNPCYQTYRGASSFSEPETQAIRDFVQDHNFVAAFNYHSYGNLLIHPFGYVAGLLPPEPDLTIFREYGNEMTKYNNYLMGTGIETVGYTVNGEADDWFYGQEGIYAYTPEVGNSNDGFWPASDRILPLAEENLYPNQFLSLIVGSNYDVKVEIPNNSFESGEEYSMSLLINNSGLGDSNGDVYIDIISSENILFSEDNLMITGGVDARTEVELDGLVQFEISNNSENGTLEEITVNIYDNDNIIATASTSIVIGDPILFVSDQFNVESGWTVGSLDDDATSGVWDRAIPQATYYEGVIVQPGTDSADQGSYCFITGSGTQNNNVGYDDVDGGKTSLISPIFDLSEFGESIVTYEQWYSNNVGDNPGSDYFEFQVSNDGGNSWLDIYSSNITNNDWIVNQHLLSNYIELTDEVQFKFIASDEYYNGDNGTGGSIIEAAVDDFNIFVFEDSSCNNQLGDVNGDSIVNVLDVVSMINYILETGELSEICAADINLDGTVNVLDIVLVVNIILG